MGKKSKIAGKVDNGLKERLRANMKAKKKGTPCYAFGMALNPKMRSVLGEEHRALLVVKSGDPDIDLELYVQPSRARSRYLFKFIYYTDS